MVNYTFAMIYSYYPKLGAASKFSHSMPFINGKDKEFTWSNVSFNQWNDLSLGDRFTFIGDTFRTFSGLDPIKSLTVINSNLKGRFPSPFTPLQDCLHYNPRYYSTNQGFELSRDIWNIDQMDKQFTNLSNLTSRLGLNIDKTGMWGHLYDPTTGTPSCRMFHFGEGEYSKVAQLPFVDKTQYCFRSPSPITNEVIMIAEDKMRWLVELWDFKLRSSFIDHYSTLTYKINALGVKTGSFPTINSQSFMDPNIMFVKWDIYTQATSHTVFQSIQMARLSAETISANPTLSIIPIGLGIFYLIANLVMKG